MPDWLDCEEISYRQQTESVNEIDRKMRVMFMGMRRRKDNYFIIRVKLFVFFLKAMYAAYGCRSDYLSALEFGIVFCRCGFHPSRKK